MPEYMKAEFYERSVNPRFRVPILTYSELSDHWETRKVDVFEDGSMTFADESHETVDTGLSETEIPTIAEINQNVNFHASAIDKNEFERVWREARSANGFE